MPALPRRNSAVVNVGGVKVGGPNPIVVQSMTNTDTADSASTVNQVMELARAARSLFASPSTLTKPPKRFPGSSTPSATSVSTFLSSAIFITTAICS